MKAIMDSQRCNDQDYISRIIGLCDDSRDRFYRKDAVLFTEGSPVEGVLHIKSGKARIFKPGYGGQKQIVRFVSEGDIIGVKSAITGKKHSLSATALEDMMVCFIPRDHFLALLVKTPDLAFYLIDCLSSTLLEAETKSISLIQKNESQRLAEALLRISAKFDSDEIQLLKTDLAGYTSIERKPLTSCLRNFRDNRLIALNSERIKILDMEGLEQEASIPA